jgi:serine/threonine protein kinase/WD40 repeat protein
LIACPSREELDRLLAGRLNDAEEDAVSAHVESCAGCRIALEEILHGRDAPSWSQLVREPPDQDPDPAFLTRLGNSPPPDWSSADWSSVAPALDRTGGPAPPTSEFAGDLRPKFIPGYEILSELGRGGMGVVYKARQIGLDRRVAIKMVLAGQHADWKHLARFRAEANAVARLQHPNIVQVYEVGEHDGQPFLALELVEGGTLADYPIELLPFRSAAELTLALAEAVACAHDHGVVHRDLKPANVLLVVPREVGDGKAPRLRHAGGGLTLASAARQSPLPTPKITDFGLAKLLVEDSGPHTQTGAILGTPSYMAPEQAAGSSRGIGPGCDIYALGAILYELISGRPPFRAETPMETLNQVISVEPASPSQWRPNVPRDLETICLKCLEKEPVRRYATARALADDLLKFLSDQPIEARRTTALERTWRWCRRNPFAASLIGSVAVLLLVLGIGVPVTLLLRAERDRALSSESRALNAERRAWDAEQDARIRSHLRQAAAYRRSGRVGQRYQALREVRQALSLDPSPELRHELRDEAVACLALPDLDVVQEFDWPTASDLLDVDPLFRHYARSDVHGNISIRRLKDDIEVGQIPGEGKRVWLQFSPNGRYLAIQDQSTEGEPLIVWRLDGEEPAAALRVSNAWGYSFSSENGRIAIGHASQPLIRVYDLDSGGLVGELDGPIRPNLAFHPTDQLLAVVCGRSVTIRDISSGEVFAEFESPHNGFSPVWHPQGAMLAIHCDDKKIYLYNVAERKFVRHLKGHKNFGMWSAFNHSGDLLVSNDWHSVLRLWDPSSGRQLWKTPFFSPLVPRFSPDDQRLAAAIKDSKLCVYRLSAGAEVRTLAPQGRGQSGFGNTTVHPGGRILAVMADNGTNGTGVVLFDVISGNSIASLSVTLLCPLMFAADGSLVTYGQPGVLRWPLRRDEQDSTRWILGPPQRIGPPTSHDRMGASQDARVLAIGQFQKGALLIQLDAPDRDIQLGPQDDVRFAAVSPDGNWVATGSHSSRDVSVKVWDAHSGARITNLPVRGSSQVGFSPNGRWLATTGGRVRLWSVGSWKEGPFVGGDSFAFSADSKLLAIGEGYGIVRLVDPERGREYARLELPVQARLLPECFTPDGSRLVCHALETNVVHVWNLRMIRQELAEMGLDWDAPTEPPIPAGLPAISSHESMRSPEPLTVEVLLGELNQTAEQKAREEIERFRHAWEQHPDDPQNCNSLAWYYLMAPESFRNVPEALTLAKKAVELDPTNPNSRNTLGLARYRAGDYRAAVEILRDNVDRQEDRYVALDLYFLAMSHHQLGDSARARDYYDWAERWAPLQLDLSPAEAGELEAVRQEAAVVLGLGANSP